MTMFEPVEDPRTRPTRAWVRDVAVVVFVGLLSLPYLFSGRSDGHNHVAEAIGTALLVLPLLVRRVWPLPTFAFVLAVAVGFAAWDVTFVGSLALPVALYTVVALGPRRQAYVASAVLELFAAAVAILEADSNGLLLYFVLLSGMVAAALGLGLYSSTRRAYIRELVDRAERLEREHAQAADLAAAGERARIAREMHDIVAHHLTMMVSLSDAAARLARVDPDRAVETMTTVSATGRDALRDTRSLLGLLGEDAQPSEGDRLNRRPVPDLAAIETLVEQVRDTGLTLRMQGVPVDVPADAQLATYRIVQESLTNTMKHAPERTIANVTLRFAPTSLDLIVVDDGGGQPTADQWQPGRGTTGMRARVQALGGHVESGPRPTGGWSVSATIPLGQAARSAGEAASS